MSQAKVVFVTGAASGIGRAVAERLTNEGSSVVVADSDVTKGHETCESIASAGGRVIFQEIDVRDRGSIRSAADNATSRLGEITGLVNCAGVVTMTSLADLTEEEWDLVVDVNLKGTWLVTQEVARDIASTGGGSVVNISTVEAEVVVSSAGYCQVHYNASKGGVKMLTKLSPFNWPSSPSESTQWHLDRSPPTSSPWRALPLRRHWKRLRTGS